MLKFIFDTLWTCGARPPVCKDRLLRAYRLPDAACGLGEARGKGAIMAGVSFAELCYFVWGRMVLRAKRKIATVLP